MSGGVAVLFNINLAFQLERSYSDLKGRFIICDIKTNKSFSLCVVTIYALKDDDPAFLESFFKLLQDFHCDDMILGDDFN